MTMKELLDLLEEAEQIAEEKFEGHMTILRFGTGWKVLFGTPVMLPEQNGDYEIVQVIDHGMTLKGALHHALAFPLFLGPPCD
jgi:hypothetical protein